QPRGDFDAVASGKLSHDLTAIPVPRESKAASRKFLRVRQIKEGRQQNSLLHRADRRKLRDGQHTFVAHAWFVFCKVVVRQRTVGGAEINSNGVAAHVKATPLPPALRCTGPEIPMGLAIALA